MRGRLRALSEGERIVLVGGVLLVADLLLLPWHSVDLGGLDIPFDTTRTAVQSPYPGYGVAAVILTLVMVAQIVIARLLAVRLADAFVPWPLIHLVAGVFVAVLLVVKLVRETEFLGYGAYSGVLAALLVAYGGYAISRDAARAAQAPPPDAGAGAPQSR